MADASRDLLVLAKTIGTSDFPIERPTVVGADRETGALLRLTPFPWKDGDSDPPVRRWSWLDAPLKEAPRDPRPDSREPAGAPSVAGYVEARDGWLLRNPFVRPHEHGSLEAFSAAAKAGGPSLGYVRPRDGDVLLLPLRLVFRCAEGPCDAPHELVVLDWELHEMARLLREREGVRWATAFRERWGASLFARFDVRILVSTYAQAPSRAYVAGLHLPPREAEDEHAHVHHVAHRTPGHGREAGARSH